MTDVSRCPPGSAWLHDDLARKVRRSRRLIAREGPTASAPRSREGSTCDGRWFAAREQPRSGGCDERESDDEHDQIDDRWMVEAAEIASVPGDEREVRAGGAEQGAEQCQRSGGRAGQRATRGA